MISKKKLLLLLIMSLITLSSSADLKGKISQINWTSSSQFSIVVIVDQPMSSGIPVNQVIVLTIDKNTVEIGDLDGVKMLLSLAMNQMNNQNEVYFVFSANGSYQMVTKMNAYSTVN